MTNNQTTLGYLEQAAYQSRWRDGLLDLIGGGGVLIVGITWSFEAFWATGFAVPVLFLLWIFLRRRVVEPRIGRVTFRSERREREKSGTRAAIWVGVGTFLFFIILFVFEIRNGRAIDSWIRDWIAGLPVALLGLMALQAAAMTGLIRFAGYGAILVVTGAIATPFGMEPGPQILIGGGFIFLWGIALFFRFLLDHPIPEDMGEEL